MIPYLINKTNIAVTKFLKLVNIEYKNKDGIKSTWISAERTTGANAVMIVPVITSAASFSFGIEKSIVLIREYRVPIGGYEWGFPAGLIDPGESVEATVTRELKEETGLNVQSFIRPISPMVYNSAGLTNEAISIAYVEASGEISNKGNEASEDIQVFVKSRQEVKQLMSMAIFPDSEMSFGAKAWIILQRFVDTGEV